ncbi:MAG: hypothetical protein HY596_01200 [Candidatus Omnitrophica bacterium]|nr:hypothetical protein [Candidatus Omnitrophota bacterium]
MIRLLRKLLSVANLRRKRAQARGQIATVLLLAIVAVLLFTLMTANLGQVSLVATNAANASDSASLYLASQLSTKSHQLWESLGHKTQKCQKKGFFGSLFAIIFAIVMIVLQQYEFLPVAFAPTTTGAIAAAFGSTTAPIVAAGAIGGFVGGAIGGAVTGTNPLIGALQGALIGASIGFGVGSAQNLAASFASSAGTKAGAAAAAVGTGSEFEIALAFAKEFNAFMASYAAPFAIGGGAFSAGTSLFNSVMSDLAKSDAIAAAAKALSGLPETLRIQQGVIFRALSETVDDPTKVQDVHDADGDGDTQEQIPRFLSWWDQRVKALKDNIPTMADTVSQFVNGPMTTFHDAAEATYKKPPDPGMFARQEVEGSGMEGSDGELVDLARRLENAGHPISFWAPGPTAAQIDDSECEESACDAAPLPPGWDEVDETIERLQQLAGTGGATDEDKGMIDNLKDQTVTHNTATWESWSKLFYDPDPQETDDFYDEAAVLVNGGVFEGESFKGIKAWKEELQSVKVSLPQCQPQYDEEDDQLIGVSNPPCQDLAGSLLGEPFATSDADFADEFVPVETKLNQLVSDIESFRPASKDFVTTMTTLSEGITTDFGGKNPAGYAWSDSRGDLSVEVEVGPFKVARTKKKSSFKKICIVLKDYADDGSRSWVKITRQDPVRDAGFWRWNDYGGKTAKLSRSAYSFNFVKIAGTQ